MKAVVSNRGRIALAVVALVAALALAACGSSSDSDSGASTGSGSTSSSGSSGDRDATPVRLSIVNGFGTLPIEVASERDFFARNGLDVDITSAADQSTFAPALGRQYDVIMGTPMDFFAAASRGIPVRALATSQRNSSESPNNQLVTRDPSIRTIADLSGKRVGVVGLAGTSYASTTYLLKQAGVDPQDVTFVPTPFPTMQDQLDAGRIDAAVSTTPFVDQLKADGYRSIVDPPTEALGEGSPNTLFSTSPDFLREHPQVAQQFRAAIGDATSWIEANPEEARRVLAEWLRLPPEAVEQSPLPAFGRPEVTVEQIEPMVRVIEASGLVQGRIPPVDGLVVPQ